MFVFLNGVKERSKPRHTLTTHFDGAPVAIDFCYGQARVDARLAEWLISTGRATRDFRGWGTTMLARGVSLARAA